MKHIAGGLLAMALAAGLMAAPNPGATTNTKAKSVRQHSKRHDNNTVTTHTKQR
jgi:hypothetical protein